MSSIGTTEAIQDKTESEKSVTGDRKQRVRAPGTGVIFVTMSHQMVVVEQKQENINRLRSTWK